MGKQKYKSILDWCFQWNQMKINQGKEQAFQFFKGCKVPKLLTYSNLVEQWKTIDIGTVYEIDPGLRALALWEHH